MSAVADARRLGETIGGKYRLVRFLAAGGMGVVYEAQHTLVRRRFAVKFLRREFAERREILTRFQREAEAAGALESENVTAAVDFGISVDGSPYIVMEYLVGESLEALLEREKRLPLGRSADLVLQACRGIVAAHAAGIVHRDLKPHNLFVCRREDGTDLLKVLDFGIAKLEVIDDGQATSTGMVLGTPAYMSPEQARGDKSIDARVDVYGLAAILYQLVSGTKPHPGDSHNAILHHIATQPAIPLDAALGLPAPFVALVEHGLASDPGARQPTAEALAEELAGYARRDVWPAAAVDETPSSELSSRRGERTGEVLTGSKPALPAPRRGRRSLVAFAAVVALTGTALAVRGFVRPAPVPAPARVAAASALAQAAPGGSEGATVTPPAAPPSPAPTAIAASAPVPVRAHGSGSPGARPSSLGRPRGRPSGRPETPAPPPPDPVKPPHPAGETPAPPVTFDQQNPYN